MNNFCLEIEIFFKLPEKSKCFQNLPEKIESFFKICLEKSKFFENLPGKIEICIKLPGIIEISLKFEWKNRNFFDPDPRPPRFQTRLTPLAIIYIIIIYKTYKYICLPRLSCHYTGLMTRHCTTLTKRIDAGRIRSDKI